jgi:hypothetical protein
MAKAMASGLARRNAGAAENCSFLVLAKPGACEIVKAEEKKTHSGSQLSVKI